MFSDHQSRRSLPKRNEFGIVNIVQEVSPIRSEIESKISTVPTVMDTIVQKPYVAPSKVEVVKVKDEITPTVIQSTVAATEASSEQIAPIVDEIRKYTDHHRHYC